MTWSRLRWTQCFRSGPFLGGESEQVVGCCRGCEHIVRLTEAKNPTSGVGDQAEGEVLDFTSVWRRTMSGPMIRGPGTSERGGHHDPPDRQIAHAETAHPILSGPHRDRPAWGNGRGKGARQPVPAPPNKNGASYLASESLKRMAGQAVRLCRSAVFGKWPMNKSRRISNKEANECRPLAANGCPIAESVE